MATAEELQSVKEVLDPVCGMTIDPADAVGHVEHRGHTYYFCNQSCLERFQANPDQFLTPTAPPVTGPVQGAEYTCQMEPYVRHDHPGPCPKCGMALEPVAAAAAARTEWTCPMHPEIVRDEPGACPICGMALEPRVVAVEERNPELDDMSRR